MTAVPKSPDALELRSKPLVGPRLGKRAALIAAAILLGMVALIIFNVESRKQSEVEKPQQAAAAVAHLQASTDDAEALSRNVSLEVRAGREPMVDLSTVAENPERRGAPPQSDFRSQPVPYGDGDDYTVPDLSGSAAGYDAAAAQAAQEQLRLQQEAARIEQDARARPTSVQGWAAPSAATGGQSAPGQLPGAGVAGASLPTMPDISGLMAGMGGAGAVPGMATQPSDKERKEDWLRAGEELQPPILGATRQPPRSAFELKTGHVINAVLLQGINTDLPGDVSAMVTDNVYDTATGRHLLIPAWTKIYGRYNADVAFGQGRVPVLWSRLIYPDGSTLELGGMQATDTAGFAGMEADVNNHYGRLIAFAALSSVMSAGVQLSQPQEVGPNGQLTNRQIVAGEVGREISQLGVELTRRNMRVQPTLTQQPGYRFAIMVNRDVIFAAAYVAK